MGFLWDSTMENDDITMENDDLMGFTLTNKKCDLVRF